MKYCSFRTGRRPHLLAVLAATCVVETLRGGGVVPAWTLQALTTQTIINDSAILQKFVACGLARGA